MCLQHRAAGKEQSADDESSTAEADTVAYCVVFESLRIDMLTMRDKVRMNGSDQQVLPVPFASNGWPQNF